MGSATLICEGLVLSTTERFGFKEAAEKVVGAEAERRLHLVALDYWHDLSGDRAMPDFRQLTPEGLSPFRSESLLLDFSETGQDETAGEAHIRFVGDTLATVLSDQLETEEDTDGILSTRALATTDFGRELMAHLHQEAVRQKPQEFEYEDDLIGGRGILMPLSLGEKTGSFVWIVATFDFIAYRAQHAQADATEIFAKQLSDARQAWEETPHLGAGARTALYKTLQSAFKLFEQAEADPVAWKKLLANSGLRQQARAPFTPALKLVFGKDHDKTRLTEYAAALAHARRNHIDSVSFIDWIEAVPGGIKGCVEQERLAKRAGKQLGASHDSKITVLSAPTLGQVTLEAACAMPEGELVLAYVRRTADGFGEVVVLAPASKKDEAKAHTLLKATRKKS